MSKKFYKYLLGTIGKALPRSGLPLGSIGKKFRQFCAKRIVQQMGIPGNIEKGAVLHETNIIGNKTAIGINCILTEGVVLGSHVMMGPECLIYTRNHKFDKEAKKYIGYTDVRPVIIEDFVWLGARVIILPGVTIGKGSTIGAGAVVTKSVPPYSLVAGNPARVIKSLLD